MDRCNRANHVDVRILVGSIAARVRVTIRRSGSLCLAALGGAGQVERQRGQQRLGLSIGWSGPWALDIGLGGGNADRGPRVGPARREVRIIKLWAEAPIRQKINLFRHD